MSCLPVSPASPSASPESNKENQIPGTSGLQLSNAFVSYDPDLRYWKTSQALLLPSERLYTRDYYETDERQEMENGTIRMTLKPYKLPYHPMSDEFLETWPRAGMIVAGKLFRLLKWERRINEIGSGFWRTPTKHEGSGGPHRGKRHRPDATVQLRDQVANQHMWPTPAGRDWRSGKASPETHAKNSRPLNEMVTKFPTPSNSMMTVGDMEQARFAGNDPKRPSYNEANRKWATPSAWDSVGSHGGGQGRSLRTDVHGQGGQLNPDWVCWLMGWPVGADSLEPMPDLMWLDWEIDPADMEGEVLKWRTPDSGSKDNVASPTKCVIEGTARKDQQVRLADHVHLQGSNTGPIPRVATGIKDRVNRLKALGNGQVPQCMATAWNILTGDWFDFESPHKTTQSSKGLND